MRRPERAIAKLTGHGAVDQKSLDERLARMTNYESNGDPDRAQDLGAELRWAAEVIDLCNVSRLAFSETPDIQLELRFGDRAEGAAFEVRRLRMKDEDAVDEGRLRAAAGTGLAVTYGDSAMFQDMVARAVRKKLSTARPQPNHVLVLVSDSPNEIEDMELRAGAREAVMDRDDPETLPFGAIVCWWTPYRSRRWCVRAATSLLSKEFVNLLEAVPSLVWFP